MIIGYLRALIAAQVSHYRWTGDSGQLVHPARRAAGAPVWWCEITRPVVVTPLPTAAAWTKMRFSSKAYHNHRPEESGPCQSVVTPGREDVPRADSSDR